VTSLDPGVRQFQTAYSPTGEYAVYAEGEKGFQVIYKEAKKTDWLISQLAKGQELSSQKRGRLKKKLARSRERAKNLVDEVKLKIYIILSM